MILYLITFKVLCRFIYVVVALKFFYMLCCAKIENVIYLSQKIYVEHIKNNFSIAMKRKIFYT